MRKFRENAVHSRERVDEIHRSVCIRDIFCNKEYNSIRPASGWSDCCFPRRYLQGVYQQYERFGQKSGIHRQAQHGHLFVPHVYILHILPGSHILVKEPHLDLYDTSCRLPMYLCDDRVGEEDNWI